MHKFSRYWSMTRPMLQLTIQSLVHRVILANLTVDQFKLAIFMFSITACFNSNHKDTVLGYLGLRFPRYWSEAMPML